MSDIDAEHRTTTSDIVNEQPSRTFVLESDASLKIQAAMRGTAAAVSLRVYCTTHD